MRKFGPKKAGHPSIGDLCIACGKPFKAGDYTTLVEIGPGDDEDAREAIKAGRPYNAIAKEVHWECTADGILESVPDALKETFL